MTDESERRAELIRGCVSLSDVPRLKRQRILWLVKNGFTQAEIAHALGVSRQRIHQSAGVNPEKADYTRVVRLPELGTQDPTPGGIVTLTGRWYRVVRISQPVGILHERPRPPLVYLARLNNTASPSGHEANPSEMVMNEHYQAVLADLEKLKAKGEELVARAEAGIAAIRQLMQVPNGVPLYPPVDPGYGHPGLPPVGPAAEVMPAPRRLKPYYGRRAEVPTVLEARVDESYAQFSVSQAIFRFLSVNPQRSFTASEVAMVTGKRAHTVRCSLSLLYRQNKIARDAPGRYRARLEQVETQANGAAQ